MANRLIIAIVAGWLGACWSLAAADRPPYVNPFQPNGRTGVADAAFASMLTAATAKDWAACSSILENLLRDQPGELGARLNGAWLSASAWATSLPAETRFPLAQEYRKQFDARALAAFDRLKASSATRLEAYAQLASRFPLSNVAGLAWAEAADRAVLLGDAWTAHACYGMAEHCGMDLGTSRTARFKACARVLGDGTPPAFTGALPVETSWYNNIDAFWEARYVPFAAGDIVFLSGSGHLLAYKATGEQLWEWTLAERKRRPVDRGYDRGRGPIYQPAALAGADGAKIIVGRHRRPDLHDFALRAFRAADGQELWSTDRQKQFEKLCFAGTPLVSGRYVYATAKDYGQSPPTAAMVVLGLMDGRLLWQTSLGTLSPVGNRELRARREEDEDQNQGWDDFSEQSEPAVAQDLLLTAGAGHVIALGRLDGKLRWVRPYEQDREAAFVHGRQFQKTLPPKSAGELVRYRGTPAVCGNMAVVAPQDSAGAMGLDVRSGGVKWESDEAAGMTLIGGSGNVAVFAGERILGVVATSGKAAWRYEAGRDHPIVGPSAVSGDRVYVPTSRSVAILSASTGRLESGPKPPDLAALLSQPAVKEQLATAEIADSFKRENIDQVTVGAQVIRMPTGPAPQAVVAAVGKFAAGWRIANCAADRNAGWQDEFNRRQRVLATHPLNPATACILARIIRLPKDKRYALRFAAARDPKGDWKLVVRVNGQETLGKLMDRNSPGAGWHEVYIDLAPHAGRSVLVELINQPTGWDIETAYWADLKIEAR